MPADERLKIIFHRVHVRDDADTFGDGEFLFIARAGSQQVGNASRQFNAVEGGVIVLPQPEWSGVVDVRGLSQLIVSFQVKEADVFGDEDLGTMRHTLRRPFTQQSHRHAALAWLLEWEVQLAANRTFGRHPPSTVFATRTTAGGVTATTVSGSSFLARGEIHPVLPVPVPPPATVLPVRPAFPIGAPPEQPGLGAAATIVATDPINIIPNPAVIPILGPPEAATMGPHLPADLDAAMFANERNCARLEFTYFRPQTLAFTATDPRLEWNVVTLSGAGNASFLGPARGTSVRLFGTSVGEVLVECRFKGVIFATYRALVRNLRRIPCRINILTGDTADSVPRASAADAKLHLDIANRFLRQLALELTLDTNPSRTHGARATTFPGIFRIPVRRGQTRGLSTRGTEAAVLRNHRPGVMNFAYVQSDRDGNLGAATDFPNSALSPANLVQDPGTPSSSWIRPTGVGIGADATAAPVTMQVIAGRSRAAHPQLFGMYVTDGNGGSRRIPGNHATPARQREYANTISHEFGHILNLGHRVEGTNRTHPTPGIDMPPGTPLNQLSANGIFWDRLLHPPHENVMQWHDPSTLAQDFDILQALAVQQSPLVSGALVVPPAVAPPPPPPPPAPRADSSREHVIVQGEWLAKIAERHGMTWQELYAFDGGSGTPNRQRLRSGKPDLIYPGEVILVPASPTEA